MANMTDTYVQLVMPLEQLKTKEDVKVFQGYLDKLAAETSLLICEEIDGERVVDFEASCKWNISPLLDATSDCLSLTDICNIYDVKRCYIFSSELGVGFEEYTQGEKVGKHFLIDEPSTFNIEITDNSDSEWTHIKGSAIGSVNHASSWLPANSVEDWYGDYWTSDAKEFNKQTLIDYKQRYKCEGMPDAWVIEKYGIQLVKE